jgi:hypothetical protein
MAWHMGHPLSQTLFTSIYLDKLLWPVPKTVEDARFDRTRPSTDLPLVNLVLRAYCLALVKACDFVHSRVAAEYFFEVSSVLLMRTGWQLMAFRALGRRLCYPALQPEPFERI